MWRPRAWSCLLDEVGDRRLAGAREPREPEDAGLLALLARARLLVDVRRLPVDVLRPPQGEVQQAGADRVVRQAVDQDEAAGVAVLLVGVEGDRAVHGDVAHADLVQLQPLGGEMLQSIDVDPVLRMGDRRGDGLRPDLQPVGPAGEHRLIAHPHDRRLELVGHPGGSIRGGDDVAAADVDLVGQRQRDRLSRHGLVEIALMRDEPCHPAVPPRGLHADAITRPDGAARHDAGEPAEIGMGPVDPLDGHAEGRRASRA